MSDALLLLLIAIAVVLPALLTIVASVFLGDYIDAQLNWWQSRLFGTLFLLAFIGFVLFGLIEEARFATWFVPVYFIIGTVLSAGSGFYLWLILDVRKPRRRKIKRLPIS